jgi:Zn finger protein HypA/HybF involved in hydrogenase expression
VAGRQFEPAEIDELIEKRVIGPLQGFRSKMGRPFAAIIRMTPELKPEFDFGQNDAASQAEAAATDLTGQEPLGKCPKCGTPVYEHGMNYACEKTIRKQGCDFRTGKIILQRPIEREQVRKLLETGKTDLLEKFISKKGRPFKAYLVLKPDGKVGFEFEPRPAKKTGEEAATKKEPAKKIDLTGRPEVGICPKCGGKVFEVEDGYICEKSQADKRPCKFRIGKTILQQPVEPEQAKKLLAQRRTDLLDKFISKYGKPFSAHLVLDDDGKVTFEFAERESGPGAPA